MAELREGRRAAAHSADNTGTGWSLNLGTVSGIPIRIHFTFFLLLGYLAFVHTSPGSSRLFAILYIVGIFACVVLHELGHSIVAQRYGIDVAEIVLYPIGGIARMERLPKPRQELWIALAGPAVNIVIAAALYSYLSVSGTPINWNGMSLTAGNFLHRLLTANIMLAAFNMIPAFPMDGGRVMRALLAMRYSDLRATEIASGVGQFLAILLGFLGFYLNPLLLVIAFFVFMGAGQEAAMYRSKALVEGLTARAAMITDYRTLPVGATLKEAADALLSTSQQDFPVMNGDEVVGVLYRQNLLRGLADEGPGAYVAGSMTRDFLSIAPNSDLESLASEMQADRISCVLVMEEDKLLGLITLENLAELLVVRQLTQRRQEEVKRAA